MQNRTSSHWTVFRGWNDGLRQKSQGGRLGIYLPTVSNVQDARKRGEEERARVIRESGTSESGERERFGMNIASARILRGRDRMTDVLTQYLGPVDALERANNIAQALVLGAGEPAEIAREMLDDVRLGDAPLTAAEVGKAWYLGIARPEIEAAEDQ